MLGNNLKLVVLALVIGAFTAGNAFSTYLGASSEMAKVSAQSKDR